MSKPKTFTDLRDWKEIDKWNNKWHFVVKSLNKGNPALVGSDFHCYCCNIALLNHIDKFGNTAPFVVSFRYKPHKSSWREEAVCTACFYALQNPLFTYFYDTSWGYPGIPTQYQTIKGWFYKDIRDLSDWDEEFQNPTY